MRIKVARIFNTYGPRMHPNDGRVVSNFIVQALKGDPITVYGDGMQTRSFCYVDDLIDGCLRLMKTPIAGDRPNQSRQSARVHQLALAETVIRMTGSASRIEFRPLPAHDPSSASPTWAGPSRRSDGSPAGGWKKASSRQSDISKA